MWPNGQRAKGPKGQSIGKGPKHRQRAKVPSGLNFLFIND